jgi:hypothetical protein
MGLLLGGCVVLAAMGAASVAALPRQGRPARFVGTWIEPYVALALVSGLAAGVTMMLSGAIALLGF